VCIEQEVSRRAQSFPFERKWKGRDSFGVLSQLKISEEIEKRVSRDELIPSPKDQER
jgi:hypothetical protein